MSAIAVICFIGSALIIWGGLVASIIFLSMKPSVEAYPDGGIDADDIEE